MKSCIERGHIYELLSLDGEIHQKLVFVKRLGGKYPGNTGQAHPGTTVQSVIRALVDRVSYLTCQGDCLQQDTREDIAIINNLRDCLFLLEHRAMREHGLDASQLTQHDAVHAPMCPQCGHVHCNHGRPA
jgi:hypothetical protein